MALGNLLSHCIVASVPARLTTAHLSYVETGSVQALAHFDSLTNVTLDACLAGNGHLPNAKYVDLSSLGSLPSLTSLTLASGNFVQLQVLKHLTSLSVEFAQVDSVDSCQFVATLVTLVVSRSALDNFHANGISACSSLQSLQCQEGFIGAADASERMAFQDSRHHVPQSMSKLTALTALDLRFVSHRDVQLGWIAKLTSLQDVCVDVRADYVMLPMSISRLNQLTNLDISATGQIELNFDWSGLVALQSLLVQGSVKICQDLSDLAMLQALKRVLFCDMTCSDPFVTVQIGMLGHKLGATRPDVMFELEL